MFDLIPITVIISFLFLLCFFLSYVLTFIVFTIYVFITFIVFSIRKRVFLCVKREKNPKSGLVIRNNCKSVFIQVLDWP
jgi:hypothetical protein